MLTKFPAGVVVTLFRPFPWEVKKVIVALSALEAIIFLAGTLIVFFRNGFWGFFRKIFSDPNLTFFLSFSLIFAFAVGVSSYNFGALSRYKIPCLPFYAALLIILYYSKQPSRLTIKKSTSRKVIQYS
jgi:ABC-type Fe3+ transport system permease subunit